MKLYGNLVLATAIMACQFLFIIKLVPCGPVTCASFQASFFNNNCVLTSNYIMSTQNCRN